MSCPYRNFDFYTPNLPRRMHCPVPPHVRYSCPPPQFGQCPYLDDLYMERMELLEGMETLDMMNRFAFHRFGYVPPSPGFFTY